ncbi:hypothetical protein D3C84_474200 [compost metagenome]
MRTLFLLPLLLGLAACGHGGEPDDARALRDRLYSGCAHAGEFLTPESLPAIPPSFDEDVQ